MEIRNRTYSYKEIKKKQTSNFGGWSAYFKLYAKFLAKTREESAMMKLVPLHGRIWMHLSMLLQVTFKPLKQFYSVVTTIEGRYRVIDGEFVNDTVTKSVRHKIFGMYLEVVDELSAADLKELVD